MYYIFNNYKKSTIYSLLKSNVMYLKIKIIIISFLLFSLFFTNSVQAQITTKYNIQLTVVVDGIEATQANYKVTRGDTTTVQYSPLTGYNVDSVAIDDSVKTFPTQNSYNTYTFKSVDTNHIVRLYLKIKQYNVSFQSNQPCNFWLNGNLYNDYIYSASVHYKNSVNLTFQAPNLYYIDSIFVNNRLIKANSNNKNKVLNGEENYLMNDNYTFRNMKGDSSLRVVYKAIKAPDSVLIDSLKIGTESVLIYFKDTIKNNGAFIEHFLVQSSKDTNIRAIGYESPILVENLKNDSSYTFYVRAYNVAGYSLNKPISQPVIPRALQQTIQTNSNEGGTITNSGTVRKGGNFPIKIYLHKGYNLDSVFINDSAINLTSLVNGGADSIKILNLNNVIKDYYIQAVFKIKTFPINLTYQFIDLNKVNSVQKLGGTTVLSNYFDSTVNNNFKVNYGDSAVAIFKSYVGYKIDSIAINNSPIAINDTNYMVYKFPKIVDTNKVFVRYKQWAVIFRLNKYYTNLGNIVVPDRTKILIRGDSRPNRTTDSLDFEITKSDILSKVSNLEVYPSLNKIYIGEFIYDGDFRYQIKKVNINGKDTTFPYFFDIRYSLYKPLNSTETETKFDVNIERIKKYIVFKSLQNDNAETGLYIAQHGLADEGYNSFTAKTNNGGYYQFLIDFSSNFDLSLPYKSGYDLDKVYVNKKVVPINSSKKWAYTFFMGESTPLDEHLIEYSYTKSIFNVSFNTNLDTITNKNRVNKNDSFDIMITKPSGYAIDSFIINNQIYNSYMQKFPLDSVDQNRVRYVLRNIDKDFSIKVVFKQSSSKNSIVNSNNIVNSKKRNKIILASTTQYKITSSCNVPNKLNIEGVKTVDTNASVSYFVNNDNVYKVDSLFVNGTLIRPDTNFYRFSNITRNHSIRFVMKKIGVTITTFLRTTGGIVAENSTIVALGGNDTNIFTSTNKKFYALNKVLVNKKVEKLYNNNSTFFDSSFKISNVQTDVQVEVFFKSIKLNIESSLNGSGFISSIGNTLIDSNSNYRIRYNADPGYFVEKITVNGIENFDSLSSFTFKNIVESQSIIVTVKKLQNKITASVINEAGGIIYPSDEAVVNYGASQFYSITPNVGYKIKSLTINNINVPVTNNYLFNSVQIDGQTISATFEIITYIVNTSGDSVSFTKQANYNAGETAVIKFIPNTGYKIDSVKINNKRILVFDSIYRFNNMQGDSSIAVFASIKRLTITASAGNGGNISSATTTTVNYGARPIYTISENTGYVLDSLIVNGIKVSNVNTYIFDSVKSNQTIRVTFKLKTFTITASAGTGGSISPRGDTVVNYGARPTYTITKNTGYELDSLIANGIKVSNVFPYIFDSVKSNQTIRVTFKQIVSCSETKITPNIVRVGANLLSDITTFSKYKWYFDGLIKDSSSVNSYLPTTAGVYTLLGVDVNGCASNISNKYYYSQTCITPSGRLGNGAAIQANMVDNSNQIIIKWCPDILKNTLTIQVVDFNGNKLLEQKVAAKIGGYILYKNTIKANQYFIKVLDENNEVVQLSDLVNKK